MGSDCELNSHQPSGAYKFMVAPRFMGSMWFLDTVSINSEESNNEMSQNGVLECECPI